MPEWPKDKLLKHGAEFPMEERIRRYQHNIRTIRESGCAVPTSALIDSLDPAEIELWFADNGFQIHRLKGAIQGLTAHCLTRRSRPEYAPSAADAASRPVPWHNIEPEQASPASHAAHALALIAEEIELATVGVRRKVCFIERHGRSVQENLPPDTPQSSAVCMVSADGIGPGVGVLIANLPPHGVRMERAADTGAFRGGWGNHAV